LGSPAFLELSGIGDPNVLSKVNIPTIVSLPSVGTNLQDQPLTTSLYTIKPNPPPGVPQMQYNDTTNQVAEGSVAYLDIFQVLGKKEGKMMAQGLLDTAQERAEGIVQSGGDLGERGTRGNNFPFGALYLSQESPDDRKKHMGMYIK